MNVPVLVVRLHGQRIGMLFKFETGQSPTIIRFVADREFASQPFGEPAVLSESMRAANPEQQEPFWLDVTRAEFNAVTGRNGDVQLPPFFQNLLPEGAFRRFLAEEAGIDERNGRDHMAIIAACGKNLPGAVTVVWEDVSRQQLQRLVTQNNDALEPTLWAEPFQEGISISGVQPKIAVNKDANGRFVGRTHLGESAIIAKLPSAEYPRMPQLEHLCMHLAELAGIRVCEIELHPLSTLHAPHRYDLGDEFAGKFLAVTRFDRSPEGRIHFEDFAQALGVSPENKYSQSYQAIAALLLDLPGCGEDAFYELIERIEVNDLLGNADMHLKNLGLIYRDGRRAEFAPAYDITSTAVLHDGGNIKGHALHLFDPVAQGKLPKQLAQGQVGPLLSPKRLVAFCDSLRMPSTVASQRIRQLVARAASGWLEPIMKAEITPRQRLKLLRGLIQHEHMQSFFRRTAGKAAEVMWNEAEKRCAKEIGPP